MTLPVGLAAAGSGVPGDIPYRRLADRGLALSLAGLSLFASGRRGQAPLRRSDVARSDGARISLLDATAADPARVVRGATAAVAPGRRNGRDARRRTRSRPPHLPAAAPARRRGLRAVAVPVADPADRQLQLLQPAQHDDVHLPVRRRGVAALFPRRIAAWTGAARRRIRGARRR